MRVPGADASGPAAVSGELGFVRRADRHAERGHRRAVRRELHWGDSPRRRAELHADAALGEDSARAGGVPEVDLAGRGRLEVVRAGVEEKREPYCAAGVIPGPVPGRGHVGAGVRGRRASTARVLRLYTVKPSRYSPVGFPPGWHDASVHAAIRRSTTSACSTAGPRGRPARFRRRTAGVRQPEVHLDFLEPRAGNAVPRLFLRVGRPAGAGGGAPRRADNGRADDSQQ